jgi:hypothetical protein
MLHPEAYSILLILQFFVCAGWRLHLFPQLVGAGLSSATVYQGKYSVLATEKGKIL